MFALLHPPRPKLSGPFGQTTHLEVRFVGPRTRKAFEDTPGSDLDALLDSASLSGLKTLDAVLSGPDLVRAAVVSVTRLVERLPALDEVSLSLAGAIDPSKTSFVVGLHETCHRRGITFTADFVLDAEANAFDALDEHSSKTSSSSLIAVLEASRRVRMEGVTVRWMVPVVRALVYRLEALFSLARDEGVDPVLTPTSFLYSTQDPPEAALDSEDRLFLSDFIAHRLLDEEKHLQSPGRTGSYRTINALTLSGPFASAPVHKVAVLYAADGEQGYRWAWDEEDRPHLGGPVQESRSPSRKRFENTRVSQLVEQAREVGGVLLEGGYALAQWMRAAVAGSTHTGRRGGAGQRFARVLLIGAYGGEHIGDAAILGGVLLRIRARYGTTDAVLMSQRPLHTRHLIPMLEAPFNVEVEAYTQSKIRERLQRVDAVVFAGGPLIDLPKQLVKHLYTVSLARRANKSFIMEGIGPGPFPRWASQWTARRIVRMAERISVRTSTDSDTPLLEGMTPEIGRDPAFDYLATRGAELTRLRERDREWIHRLTEGTEGRLIVAVNVRPIGHLYTLGVSPAKRAEHTRFVEGRFEERLADGLRRFHRASPIPPCFVFFPMNAIQFGMSDLRSAYRLMRVLRGDVDFRVWEADASLDGVVALLRRVDIVISMRFHATIFALAQQRHVIGIDYRIGRRDKVGALLSDFGQSENCRRIDELTSDWLLDRLSVLADLAERQSAMASREWRRHRLPVDR